MKTVNKKSVEEKDQLKEGEPAKRGEIKTDLPLSEKDEVKKAEDTLQKTAKRKL